MARKIAFVAGCFFFVVASAWAIFLFSIQRNPLEYFCFTADICLFACFLYLAYKIKRSIRERKEYEEAQAQYERELHESRERMAKERAPLNWKLATKDRTIERIRYCRKTFDFDYFGNFKNKCQSAPERRAFLLLLSKLSRTKKASFLSRGTFLVRGKSKRIYLILPCNFSNIMRLADGVMFCVVATGNVPVADQLLAQKLHLENDDFNFLGYAYQQARHDLPGDSGDLRTT